MTLYNRAYAGANDLARIVEFTSADFSRSSGAGPLWHPGNVVWNLYTGIQGFDGHASTDRIRLWWDHGNLVGLGVDLGSGEVHVDTRGTTASEHEVWEQAVVWAERRAVASDSATCRLSALHSDRERRTQLDAAGYAPTGPGNPRMSLDLGAALRVTNFPDGMRLRDGLEVDIEERAAAHRDAWEHLEHIGIERARSAFSREVYERLRAAPAYDASFDFAIENPDGTIAACCICWVDITTGLALFEPVGTRAAYRGRGLAQGLILGALGRLRERGLSTALVSTAHFNTPAIRTYIGCGFQIVDHEFTYTKHVE